MKNKCALVIAFFLLFVVGNVNAETIYTYKDKDGNTVFTNVPPGTKGVQKFMETGPTSRSQKSFYEKQQEDAEFSVNSDPCNRAIDKSLPWEDQLRLMRESLDCKDRQNKSRFYERYGR